MKHIAITGAATGIGAHAARLFKARGYRVTAFDIVEPSNNVDEFIRMDLSDPSDVARVLSRLPGGFDALCNIAGIPPRRFPADKILKVNFLGLRQFTVGFLDKLSEGAAIVSLASRAGAHWFENIDQVKMLLSTEDETDMAAFTRDHDIDDVRAYNLSKEAVIVWTRVLCEEILSRGLRANSISPAAVETDILEAFVEAFGDRVQQSLAHVGRYGQPEEIAETVRFLASPESSWIKGVDIAMDGGISAVHANMALGLTPAHSGA